MCTANVELRKCQLPLINLPPSDTYLSLLWYDLHSNWTDHSLTVCTALSLTGCISNSPGIPNIFTLKISTDADLELRLGYYGKN